VGVQESSMSEAAKHGAMPGSADSTVIAAHLAGDPHAFAVLVRRYKDRVYAAAFRIVHDADDAAEVTQDTFVRAYRKLADFRGDSGLYTWLYRIATNLARNRLRDKTRKGRGQGVSLEAMTAEHPRQAQALLAATVTPGDAASAEELRAMLRACLAALPEHYREAFVLRVQEGMDYAGIAAALDIARGTVKSRMNTARKQLAECLGGKGYPLGG